MDPVLQIELGQIFQLSLDGRIGKVVNQVTDGGPNRVQDSVARTWAAIGSFAP